MKTSAAQLDEDGQAAQWECLNELAARSPLFSWPVKLFGTRREFSRCPMISLIFLKLQISRHPGARTTKFSELQQPRSRDFNVEADAATSTHRRTYIRAMVSLKRKYNGAELSRADASTERPRTNAELVPSESSDHKDAGKDSK